MSAVWLARAETCAGFAVRRIEFRVRVGTRRQPQDQFVEIEARQRGIALQLRRGIQRFHGTQLRQLATLHGVEANVLQRLQGGTQYMSLRPLHAACDEAEAAVMLA